MKIAFFTEGKWAGPVHRNNSNMRTDAAWICALNAIHFPLNTDEVQIWDNHTNQIFDLGIIIVPKKDPGIVWNSRRCVPCKKWAVMQEGPNSLFQDWSINTQISYFHFLNEVDIIFCHNEFDKRYYEGLIPHKKVSVFPSLVIEDAIPVEAKKVDYTRNGTMIGGNWCSWYSGQDSYFIAQEFGEQIWCPAMGRMREEELQIEEIAYIPYMNWSQWMVELNKSKYAVHLMRTWAAGTFPLNCARLSIPCIGWGSNDENNIHGTDTQRLLFPELTVPLGNMVRARKVAKHLKENNQFYEHCVQYAFKKYHELYSEEIFIEKFKEITNGI